MTHSCFVCSAPISERAFTCSVRCRVAFHRARREEERRAAREVLARAAALGRGAGPVAVERLARDAARVLDDFAADSRAA
jgi:predicted nucleic acid-binding Zn ribbon protein